MIESFLVKTKNLDFPPSLEKLGREGVEALKKATPVDTGKTASSWAFQISKNNLGYCVSWHNFNTHKWANIALLIDTGYTTPNGIYIEGRDYINSALEPIINDFIENVWKEVSDNG